MCARTSGSAKENAVEEEEECSGLMGVFRCPVMRQIPTRQGILTHTHTHTPLIHLNEAQQVQEQRGLRRSGGRAAR